MEKRSEKSWMGLVLALLILASACSVVGIAGIVWLARRVATPSASGQPTPAELSGDGRIAYVGADGNLYTIAPDGNGQQAVTSDGPVGNAQYNMLAWSLDGQLAFVSANDQESVLGIVRHLPGVECGQRGRWGHH